MPPLAHRSCTAQTPQPLRTPARLASRARESDGCVTAKPPGDGPGPASADGPGTETRLSDRAAGVRLRGPRHAAAGGRQRRDDRLVPGPAESTMRKSQAAPLAIIPEPFRRGDAAPAGRPQRVPALVPALIPPPRTQELLAELDPQTQARVLELMAGAIAKGTRRTYSSCARIYGEWCLEHERTAIPASDATILAFLADRAQTCKASHVERYLTAIRYLHRAHGYPPPRPDSFYLFLRGLRKAQTPVVHKAPLRPDDLIAMSDLMDEDPYETRATRDRALLLFGFAGALRRGELSGLNIEHCTFTSRGVEVLIIRSKTDQRGEGQRIAVPFGERSSTCPVRALQRWIRLLNRSTGPLFVQLDSCGKIQAGRLSGQTIALRIKHYAEVIGLDPKRYAGHSLRSGFCTSCVEQDVPLERIRGVTRHTSNDGLLPYVAEALPWQQNVTKRLGL